MRATRTSRFHRLRDSTGSFGGTDSPWPLEAVEGSRLQRSRIVWRALDFSLRLVFLLALKAAALAGCEAEPRHGPEDAADRHAIGDPLPGLSTGDEERFRRGAELFRTVFTPEDGLGPLFNENACNACHTDPADGGTGDQFLVRATRYTAAQGCDLLLAEGGDNIRQQATPLLRAHGITGDAIPERATETGRFNVPFLFGLGLVEAIPEDAILAREDPHDETGDGISGRASRDDRGRVARFGRKGHVATLFDFVEEAARLEMGLTTPLHPAEAGVNRGPLPPGTDPAPNPEVDVEALELLTDFVRFLAPPPRRLPADPQERAVVDRGERLFEAIGCSHCHVPYMETGPHPVQALSNQRIYLYSDLLLHDLGDELADVCGPTAHPSELRTEMLMGLGSRSVFLHDSRAVSIDEAIELHAGEAAAARDRFRELSIGDRLALVRFLRTL
jgi:CxxC motif-containing protein (DUF1111 family)